MKPGSIQKIVEDNFEEIVSNREHLHAHPELSFEEYETSKYVQSKLDEYGVSYQSGIAGTGIAALIEGKKPSSATIALRADMDALPIQEENEVPYKSLNDGVMHACGHDVHTANLLGVCQILNQVRDKLKGTVKCIFQPGEERMPGGASLMIKDGVLENPHPGCIIGQHVHPLLSSGSVGFRSGKMMASADEIEMRIIGKGGHGGVPHSTVDPVAISAQIITALQQIVSRNCDPTLPTVLTFGSIHSSGGTYNIIPDEVFVKGTFRTFDEKWRWDAHDKIKQMVKSIAAAMGAEAEISIAMGYPFLVNNPELTGRCERYAIDYLGPDSVHEIPMRLTAEDFSYYTHKIPGCFYRLGVANEKKGINSAVHTPSFDIDKDALKVGAGLMAWIALKELDRS